MDSVPLVVDLDGTLVATDVSVEMAFRLVRRNPLYAMALVYWLLKGLAHLKAQVAARIRLEASSLPYIEEFVRFLKDERAKGRVLFLVTAADDSHAQAISKYLGLFDLTLGSDGCENLSGGNKLKCIRRLLKEQPFDYAGNDLADLGIFSEARRAIAVHPVPLARPAIARLTNVERIFEGSHRGWRDLVELFRPGFWPVNALLLLPCVLAADQVDWGWPAALVSWIALCASSSAAYLFDDLLHLAARRKLPRGQQGPVARGAVALQRMAGWLPVLWISAFILALFVSGALASSIAGFVFLTLLLSLFGRFVPRSLATVLLCAFRIVVGATLVGTWPPFWMLGAGAASGALAAILFRTKTGFI